MAHILVIEDNYSIAKVFTSILEKQGHRVEQTDNAYEAVLQVVKVKFDLVLMDLLLHGVNGAITALALRGLGVTAPIIVITGDLMPINQEIYERAGFCAKLLKPIRSQELIDEVDRQLVTGNLDEIL